MISFVVIGRNESWKLTKCFQSILDTIAFSELKTYEIIYIDSDSSDGSLEVAKSFTEIKRFKITGDINAAVARNIGAKKAKGSILFFIDGDMELHPSFLKTVYTEKQGLIAEFVSGNWINFYYDSKGNLVKKEAFLNMDKDRLETTTGGLFLISKKNWELVGGMNNRFKKSQDIDLGLRLSQRNIFLLRKKEIAANHHSIAYRSKERIWKELFNGKHLYGRSFLYREHVFNRNIYKRFIRNDYSLIFVLLCSLIAFLTGYYEILFLYPVLILFRSKFSIRIIVYFILRDFIVFFGFFFFFPKDKFNVKTLEL